MPITVKKGSINMRNDDTNASLNEIIHHNENMDKGTKKEQYTD